MTSSFEYVSTPFRPAAVISISNCGNDSLILISLTLLFRFAALGIIILLFLLLIITFNANSPVVLPNGVLVKWFSRSSREWNVGFTYSRKCPNRLAKSVTERGSMIDASVSCIARSIALILSACILSNLWSTVFFTTSRVTNVSLCWPMRYTRPKACCSIESVGLTLGSGEKGWLG
jgi:hypothetical protein